LSRDLATLAPESDLQESRQRIAEKHGLSHRQRKNPDTRSPREYETAEMDRKHVIWNSRLATTDHGRWPKKQRQDSPFTHAARTPHASAAFLIRAKITAEILSL